jgi:hypothetical protein
LTCIVVSWVGRLLYFFGDGFQIGETDGEILADHVVHVHEHMHDLRHERTRTIHQPCDGGDFTLRRHRELGGVVPFKRLEEIELDRDLAGRSVDDFHPTGADILVAVPRIDRALAAAGTAEGARHGGILHFIRRPRRPLAKIIDPRKDRLRRRLDADRALDAENIGLGRGENKDRGNRDSENDGNDDDGFKHECLVVLK